MEFSTERLLEVVQIWSLKALMALVIFLIGRIVARILSRTLGSSLRRARVDETLVTFASNLTHAVLMVLVIIAALGQLGIQTTSFIAVLGAAGLAVGLALQGSLANFAAGIMIILFRPFKAGDFIEAGGTMGIVEAIEIFTTRMRTGDNRLIVVPNNQITAGNITNFSAKDTRRIDLVVGVSYGDDLAKVTTVLRALLAEDERILPEPAATIGVLELADSSINFAVRPWVNSADYWPTLFDLNQRIKERFDAEGISIPFPQRDVHMISAAGSGQAA